MDRNEMKNYPTFFSHENKKHKFKFNSIQFIQETAKQNHPKRNTNYS